MNDTKRHNAAELLQAALAAFESGQAETVAARFRDVLDVDPDHTSALYFLAVIAYQQGRLPAAHKFVTRAISLLPEMADGHNLHGLVLMALGRHDAACAAFRIAIAREPDFAEAENNLGAALEAMGQPGAAAAAYRRATESNPRYAQAYCNLGRVMLGTGQPAAAEESFRHALALQPDLSDARFNLAVAQHRRGSIAAAEATIDLAIADQPENAGLYRYLGALRHSRGKLAGSEAALLKAMSLDPSLTEAYDNLAGVLLDQGRIDAAEERFKQALERNPGDNRAHSNLLLCRNYRENNPGILFQAHCRWAEQHAAPVAAQPATGTRPNSRRLRIGYVSGDFRRHSVAYFFEPLLRHRNRRRFEVFCYANLENPDDTTARLQAVGDHWRWVAGIDDAQLAAQIRADEIDILVDLSGHTAGNRLLAFQHRPAPIQVTWLGYPNTTGMTDIDYRITDPIADPPGAEALWTESLIRLDAGFLCYAPPSDAPEVAPLPALSRGHVTFGSFNNLRKVTPAVIEVWAKVLDAVPTARMMLKARSFADAATRDRFTAAFGMHDIAADRIMLRDTVASPSEHLGTYAEVDIALDPFPYNGTTTTCEALWMGVPTVTLRGNRHAARVGASLLTHTGLNDWIAADTDAYVKIARRQAENIDALVKLRQGLRGIARNSSLCDAPGFALHMEAAFEWMVASRAEKIGN
ncbi:MAG: tetratricopeptide repeat protein [Alphaproteobacteria bacterium]